MPPLQDTLVGLFVITMMGSVGLELTIHSIRAVLRRPRVLVGGLAAAYIAVPLAALGLSLALGLSAPLTAGLLLCAAAPGGPVGALLTQHGRGNLALAVAMLMLFNFINVGATPLTLSLLGASGGQDILGELLAMGGTIVLFQLVPLTVGIRVRERRPALAVRAAPWAKRLSLVALLALTASIVLGGESELEVLTWRAPAAAVGVQLASLGSGWLLAGGDRPDRAAVALTNCIRSQSLAILLASTRFDSPDVLVMVLIYSAMMLPVSLPAMLLSRNMIGAEVRDAAGAV